MLTGTISKNAIVVAAVNSVPTYNGPGSVVMSSFVITDLQMMEELNQILVLKVLMFTLVTFNGSNIRKH
jgi:hypothetical protein